MTRYSLYEGKPIRLTDDQGNAFTGVAEPFPAEQGMREYGIEEEGIKLGEHVAFRSRIRKVEFLPTFGEAAAAIPPGRYRHFKGNDYEVIGIARHSETEEPMVVYRALYGERGLWCRPASMWNETVERGGKTYKRFCTWIGSNGWRSMSAFSMKRRPARTRRSSGFLRPTTPPANGGRTTKRMKEANSRPI